MGSLRVVYDTNVLVSAIGFGGNPWRCLLAAFVGNVEMLASEETLDEFQHVLEYEHLPFTLEEQARLPALIEVEATIVDADVTVQAVDDDPDDEKFLECALAGDADYVVSGDRHLRDLDEFQGIEILEPVEFLDRVERASESIR